MDRVLDLNGSRARSERFAWIRVHLTHLNTAKFSYKSNIF